MKIDFLALKNENFRCAALIHEAIIIVLRALTPNGHSFSFQCSMDFTFRHSTSRVSLLSEFHLGALGKSKGHWIQNLGRRATPTVS